MDLKQTVPWGRDFDEYIDMFALHSMEEGAKIIGCGDGPASFNAEANTRGISATSVDPIYNFSRAELSTRINEARDEVMSQVRAKADDYVWNTIKNPDDLEKRRMRAMGAFLEDYELGLKSKRYVNASLPALPFQDNAFDIGLCSHFLFLYSPQVDEQTHIESVLELCRVAREVRVYPLLSISDNERSEHLDAVCSSLTDSGLVFEEVAVNYEFQRGAKSMLRISRTSSKY